MPALALLVVAQSLIAFHFGALPSLRRIRLLVLVTVLQPAAELTLVLMARARDGGAEAMLLATALSALGVSLLAWLLLLAPGRAAAGGRAGLAARRAGNAGAWCATTGCASSPSRC